MEIYKKDIKANIKDNTTGLDFHENDDLGHSARADQPSRRLRGDLFASHQMPVQNESRLSQKVLLQLEERMVGMQKEMESLHNGLRDVVSQVNEFIRVYQSRFEKVSNSLNGLSSNYQARMSEVQMNFSSVGGQLKERKVMDIKLEEMINRHNTVLRNYESRMQQLQKLLNEKEAQFLSAQSSLNEAKMEIARLKRV